MIRNIILSAVFIISCCRSLFTATLPYELQFLFWESLNLLMLGMMSVFIFFETRYSQILKKFLSFLVMIASFFGILDYIVRLFAEFNYYHNYLGLYIYYFVISIALFVIFIISYLKYLIKSSDKYETPGSFIVYSHPKSFTGLISAIFTSPYGHCFIVVDGIKFYFKNGRIEEKPFVTERFYSYKKVNKIKFSEARALLGKKWSLINNCFSTFGRFK